MSLLRLDILNKFYERYRDRYGYGIDTWEDDLTGIDYLCETDLLFPEIDLRESIFDDSNYTDVFIGNMIPYTLNAEIIEYVDNQIDSRILEEVSARPRRLNRFCYYNMSGIKVGE